MKFTLATVLSLALIGASWWGIDSYRSRQQHSRAEAIRRLYEKDELQAKIAADELEIENAKLTVEIAEGEHRKTNDVPVRLAEERLRADRLALEMVLDRDRLEQIVSQ